jgi:hypothetical protein
MNIFKNIFNSSIFAYLAFDGIIKNIYYFSYLKKNKQTPIRYKTQTQTQYKSNLHQINQHQTKINDIKKAQINYYNKKFTKEFATQYNLNQIIKKELVTKN